MDTKTLHFKVTDISRSKVRSDNAVAACAYRCGENLKDTKTGKVHYYARRGGVIKAAIFTPDAAPEWMGDDDRKRAWGRLGNEIEAVEDGHNKRDTAMLAKDFAAAAPRELTHEQHWQKIAVPFARKLTDRGLAVAVALHESDASDGGKNPHFHFFIPPRYVSEQGFGGRYRPLSGKPGRPLPEIRKLREEYFQCVNDALADAGETGVYYDPKKQEGKEPGRHKGKAATAMERKEAERVKRERWAAMEEFLRPALASLMETGETYQQGIGDTRWERIAAGIRWDEPQPPAPAPPPSSWRDTVSRSPPAHRSR